MDMPEPEVIAPPSLENRPLLQRRGRPAGARNKRSADLGRWIAHAFGGMTPGQQAAAVALVTPEDVDRALEDAKALGIVDLGLDALTLAMTVKARKLAKALGCEAFEAWALMAKERDGLMRYVHQVQPQAREASTRPPATVFLVPEGEAHDVRAGELPGDDDDPDFIDLFAEPIEPVGNATSETDPEPE